MTGLGQGAPQQQAILVPRIWINFNVPSVAVWRSLPQAMPTTESRAVKTTTLLSGPRKARG